MKNVYAESFITFILCLNLCSGCSGEEPITVQEIGRLSEEGYVTRVHHEFRFSDKIKAKYEALPKVTFQRRRHNLKCWLTLEDWENRESPWLSGKSIAFYGRALYLIRGVEFDESIFPKDSPQNILEIADESTAKNFCENAESHIIKVNFANDSNSKGVVFRGQIGDEDDFATDNVKFLQDFKIRPLKIFWPSKNVSELRKGQFGSIKISTFRANWRKSETDLFLISLEIILVLSNNGSRPARVSAEMYLTGDDAVLIRQLEGVSEELKYVPRPGAWDYMLLNREPDKRGFVPESKFYLCYIEPDTSKEIQLRTEVDRRLLSTFKTLRFENLAYGWQLALPLIDDI